MAGGLNFKLLPSCNDHGTPCYIKTGTSEGPNKGRSFFICGNDKDKCKFVRPVSGISISNCPIHGEMNELGAFSKKEDELRYYYRCIQGRKLRIGWCSFENMKLEEQKSGPKSLRDITDVMKHKMNVKKDSTSNAFKDNTKIPQSTAVFRAGEEENMAAVGIKIPKEVKHVEETSNYKNEFLGIEGNVDVKTVSSQKGDDLCLHVAKEKEEGATSVMNLIDEDKEGKEEEVFLDWIKKKLAVEKELAARKNILRNINKESLADHGEKMKLQIERLEEILKELKERRVCSNDNNDDMKMWSTFIESQPESFSKVEQKRDLGLNLNFNLPSLQSARPSLPIIAPHAMNQRYPLYDGRMTQSKLQQVGRVTRDAIEALHSSLETCPTASTECPDPHGLNVELMTHQRQALTWLLWREKQNPSGGILADDMGLGKTLTSISLIMKDKQNGFQKKEKVPSEMKDSSGTLVVCPASLVHQWKSEIERRVKPLHLTVCLYHGSSRERNIEKLSRYDVVLTTYSIVAVETKDLCKEEIEKSKRKENAWMSTADPPDVKERKTNRDSLISQIHWRRIILDEAHTIKNPKCITSVATCYIEAESRWALTGTPIQNDTMDLYSIIKFLRCSPFNELKVWKKWVDDRSSRGKERMNTLVKSLLLRRTKEQKDAVGKPLVSLPERQALIHNVKLTGNEKEIYNLLHLYSKNMLRSFVKDKGNPGASSGESQVDMNKKILGKSFQELLEMFGLENRHVNAGGALLLMVLRLRQCCSHLSLLHQALDAETCKSEGVDIPLEEQMMNMSICDDNQTWKPVEFQPSFQSVKIRHLLTELENLKQHSSSGRETKSVTVKKRNEIVEDFNTNPHGIQVMLVSLKAGGVGLNLIGGNHLFLLDQHWNPALENQACDRIYRVGQKHNVFIHRFLCTDTIEEKITELQKRKKDLADTVLQGGKQASQKLTLQDLKTLFGASCSTSTWKDYPSFFQYKKSLSRWKKIGKEEKERYVDWRGGKEEEWKGE
eukprot:gene3749-4271_t